MKRQRRYVQFQKARQSAKEELKQLEMQRDSLRAEIVKLQQEHDDEIRRQRKELDDMRNKAIEELEQGLEEMRVERRQWQQIEAKARTVSSSAPHKVKLNIGGQSFVTTLDTLTNEKHTFFSGLFSSHFDVNYDNSNDGEVFIDRDSRHFALILNHMRGVDVSALIAELKNSELTLLKQEADFYQIDSLKELLGLIQSSMAGKWNVDLNRKHADLQVTNNEADGSTVIRKVSGGFSYAPVLGDRGFSSGVHKWRVRIGQVDADYCWIAIGVCKLSDMTSFITGDGSGYLKMYGKSSSGFELNYDNDTRGKRKWSAGTVVEVTLDCDAGRLTIDDIVIDVPRGTGLYPVFMLYSIDNQCTLLPPCYSQNYI